MSHFKAQMHQIRFLVSVCILDVVWHTAYKWHRSKTAKSQPQNHTASKHSSACLQIC